MIFNYVFNLKNDDKGQLSLELLFVFIICIILIVSLIMPYISREFDYTSDVTNAYQTKAEISQIANGINYVYSTGSGSKRTIFVNMPENMELIIYSQNHKGYLKGSLLLSDNSTKDIIVETDNTNLNYNLFLSKGFNKVVVQWRDNSSNMEIYLL